MNSTPHGTTASIDPATGVGLLSLTVADLARSLAFYTKALGFSVLHQEASTATLGAGGVPLLILMEERGARTWPQGGAGHTGLFHFAILLPSRADLGRWVRHWLSLGLPMPGQGDHLVSEALYLEDPDGNGIEVYRDRPRDQWRWEKGQVAMATLPIDMRGLLAEAAQAGEPWDGLPAGTRLGHMHLQVGDIAQAAAFYHQILGFDIVAHMSSALFLSAGGYHHHLGMNTWRSRGAGPAPAGTVGLRFFTIDLPSEPARQEVLDRIEAAGIAHTRLDDLEAIRDPWQNTILLRVAPTADASSAAAVAAALSRTTTAV